MTHPFTDPDNTEDDDVCEDCGGRYVLGSHYCFGSTTLGGSP